jgi:hypothetical protein
MDQKNNKMGINRYTIKECELTLQRPSYTFVSQNVPSYYVHIRRYCRLLWRYYNNGFSLIISGRKE